MRVARGSRARTSGFTLAELLTVVVILGIVSGIALPVFNTQRQRSYLAVARADAAAVAKALPAALMDISTVGANGVTMTLNQAGETLTLTNTGSGTPVTVTLSARLSNGSSLDASSQANNLVRSLTSYCIAIVNNGQTAYAAPEGSATGCTLGSQSAVGGSGTVGTGNALNLQPIFKAGTTNSYTWTGIGYGNGLFMATANSQTKALTSSDGLTWALASGVISGTAQNYSAPAYGNGRWVVIAQNTLNSYYSTDNGANWTVSTGGVPLSAQWSKILWTGSMFIAYGPTGNANGSLLKSTDGVTWTQFGPASVAISSMATDGNGKYLAFATSGTSAYSSTDGGNTWGSFTPNVNLASAGLAYLAGKWIAFNGQYFYYSTSGGGTWTQASGSFLYGNSSTLISNGSSAVVFNGYQATGAAYSRDGLTWTVASVPCSGTYQYVAYGNGTFAALPGGYASSTCYMLEY